MLHFAERRMKTNPTWMANLLLAGCLGQDFRVETVTCLESFQTSNSVEIAMTVACVLGVSNPPAASQYVELSHLLLLSSSRSPEVYSRTATLTTYSPP